MRHSRPESATFGATGGTGSRCGITLQITPTICTLRGARCTRGGSRPTLTLTLTLTLTITLTLALAPTLTLTLTPPQELRDTFSPYPYPYPNPLSP